MINETPSYDTYQEWLAALHDIIAENGPTNEQFEGYIQEMGEDAWDSGITPWEFVDQFDEYKQGFVDRRNASGEVWKKTHPEDPRDGGCSYCGEDAYCACPGGPNTMGEALKNTPDDKGERQEFSRKQNRRDDYEEEEDDEWKEHSNIESWMDEMWACAQEQFDVPAEAINSPKWQEAAEEAFENDVPPDQFVEEMMQGDIIGFGIDEGPYHPPGATMQRAAGRTPGGMAALDADDFGGDDFDEPPESHDFDDEPSYYEPECPECGGAGFSLQGAEGQYDECPNCTDPKTGKKLLPGQWKSAKKGIPMNKMSHLDRLMGGMDESDTHGHSHRRYAGEKIYNQDRIDKKASRNTKDPNLDFGEDPDEEMFFGLPDEDEHQGDFEDPTSSRQPEVSIDTFEDDPIDDIGLDDFEPDEVPGRHGGPDDEVRFPEYEHPRASGVRGVPNWHEGGRGEKIDKGGFAPPLKKRR